MVKEKWLVYGKKADFSAIANKFEISPVIARIIRNRDIITDEDIKNYINGSIDDLSSPNLFKDMDKGVELLFNAILENKKIRVIGDYDIDGICSTYILTGGIKKLYPNVSMDIPDRIKDGYGINKQLIDKAKLDGVEFIITCDNGIAAISEIEYAKACGITVVVTDHHEVPFSEENGIKKYKRVMADAVINHKQPECNYPFKDLCGAAIAYRFMCAVYEKLMLKKDNRAKSLYEFMDEMIVFAAIATIGDVVSLKGENRIIAKLGLKKIGSVDNVGLQALIKACNLDPTNISSFHIGFVLGPCLNATGRLESAKLGYKLLCEKNQTNALNLANQLLELNNKRKEITVSGERKALELSKNYEDDKVLVIYLPEIHESVAGIVAGRVREKNNKPTFIMTDGEGIIKGSGRSIENYDMYEELNKCSILLERFGGHKMAAGLSLKKENIDTLREMLNSKNNLTSEDLIRKIWIDVPLPISYLSEDFVKELSILEPFGKDNEKPTFAVKNINIKKMYSIGANKDIGRFTIESEGYVINALMFNGYLDFIHEVTTRYGEETMSRLKMGFETDIHPSFTYYPVINEYRGEKSVQINITGFTI